MTSNDCKFFVVDTCTSDTFGISGIVLRHHPLGTIWSHVLTQKRHKISSSITTEPQSPYSSVPEDANVVRKALPLPFSDEKQYTEEVRYFPDFLLVGMETITSIDKTKQKIVLTFEPIGEKQKSLKSFENEVDLFVENSSLTSQSSSNDLRNQPQWVEWKHDEHVITGFKCCVFPNQMIEWNEVFALTISNHTKQPRTSIKPRKSLRFSNSKLLMGSTEDVDQIEFANKFSKMLSNVGWIVAAVAVIVLALLIRWMYVSNKVNANILPANGSTQQQQVVAQN